MMDANTYTTSLKIHNGVSPHAVSPTNYHVIKIGADQYQGQDLQQVFRSFSASDRVQDPTAVKTGLELLQAATQLGSWQDPQQVMQGVYRNITQLPGVTIIQPSSPLLPAETQFRSTSMQYPQEVAQHNFRVINGVPGTSVELLQPTTQMGSGQYHVYRTASELPGTPVVKTTFQLSPTTTPLGSGQHPQGVGQTVYHTVNGVPAMGVVKGSAEQLPSATMQFAPGQHPQQFGQNVHSNVDQSSGVSRIGQNVSPMHHNVNQLPGATGVKNNADPNSAQSRSAQNPQQAGQDPLRSMNDLTNTGAVKNAVGLLQTAIQLGSGHHPQQEAAFRSNMNNLPGADIVKKGVDLLQAAAHLGSGQHPQEVAQDVFRNMNELPGTNAVQSAVDLLQAASLLEAGQNAQDVLQDVFRNASRRVQEQTRQGMNLLTGQKQS